ncbi:acyl-CoA/acyl-ACP dehydrogenase [Rhodococcus sp. BP-252]|uniref:Acyl-CoA dehydrogenase n=1 Tax=Rhodococcoides kyotonense TaxID=398843 RepID=A0A177YM76_9NOCA|nr:MULTISPECIES: acyl-CoA dehydrogenase family protein [Rhodococcus]MBY6412626.1 acyl-CoA/acyl-ACP dehydrogenase [Rhodococcus sp. BP-320]MBY6417119.1 acyl-CoA/acyl-ACP dehydrogenase [Rhodococcus sp. BP-321]MBY6423207.1 acyl-CoA/acyl-ACP dehydrogenase [Rhodococcus sp. BP-324]MBY6427143.1 acyl-CoA/acyl-ACP dehydrogenase [Rhodococcus sp. BP-323]MBY6432244.1 acyl-CoA/acyl-ACP dehydrogenase [Rhodococcus sp. BP-322]
MDFSSNSTHDDIRQAVKTLCKAFPDEYWMEHDESHEFPWEFYNAVAEGGWLGLTVPEEYGGGGLGVTEAAIVEREISASGAGMGGCSAVHIGIFGFEPIIHHGSEAMKKKYLPRVVTGELHTSFAVTEPDAGTDTTNIKTFAKKVDGGFLVSGKKVWITKAQEAEKMLLLCRTSPRADGDKRTAGMTLLFADMDRSKVQIRPIPKMGRNAVDTNELFIDELFVADDDVVGEVGHGFRTILGGLNAERVISANAALGIGEAALRRGTQYAKEREVFGRPIGKNQGIAFQLAEARIKLDAATAVVDKAAWMVDAGLPCGREANAAKYLCAEAGFFAADAALQVHGGFGFGKEFHVERYFRESRLMRIAPISQEMVLNYTAEHVLGLPRSY